MTIRQNDLVSIVMPAYNEAEGLPMVLASIRNALANERVSLEIVIVDDGSTDDTRDVVMALAKKNSDLRYLRFSRNFGKEAAITAGLRAATGDAVILMDSDGQHPVSLLPHFIERWREGIHVVAGVQRVRSEPYLNTRLKRMYYWIMEAGSLVTIPPNAGDFRLMDRRVVDAINALPERNRLMKGIYAWVGFTTEFVAFDAAPRLAGTTKFSMMRLFGLGITGVTSFTIVPLRLVAAAGVVVSAASIVFGLYLLFEHFFKDDHLPGWATLAVGMMFLSGIQLLALGVIAEYVGRTFEEAKMRPLFIIDEDSASSVTEVRKAPVQAVAAPSVSAKEEPVA